MTHTFMEDMITSNEGLASFRIPFIVREVMEGTPAEKAGLVAKDSIISVNDSVMECWSDIAPVIKASKLTPLKLGFYRDGELMSAEIIPDSLGKIGVYVTPYTEIYPLTTHTYTFWESFPAGIEKGVTAFTGYGSDFKMVFTKAGAESMGGFGTITKLFPDEIIWVYFWYITAYLSIILAFMNLLPIPGLDGGHIIFLIYEMVTGKKLSQEFMIKMQKIGMILLLFLLLYANGMDIIRALH